MRDVKKLQSRLFIIWLIMVSIVCISFWLVHGTMHHEDYQTASVIIGLMSIYFWHCGLHIVPSQEKRASKHIPIHSSLNQKPAKNGYWT